MKRRLTRAKAKIRGAGHPVRRARRGGAAGAARGRARGRLPDLQRRLRRPRRAGRRRRSGSGACSSSLMPDEPEARGLLALMLLPRRAARRRASRTASSCCWPTRTARLWDGAQIDGGRAGAAGLAGAAVRAAGRDRLAAARAADRLAAGRGALRRAARASRGSPVVALNRAVAVAEAGDVGGRAGDRRLAWGSTATATCTRPAPSCCAGSGATSEARAAYERALALGPTEPERRFLERRLSALARLDPT